MRNTVMLVSIAVAACLAAPPVAVAASAWTGAHSTTLVRHRTVTPGDCHSGGGVVVVGDVNLVCEGGDYDGYEVSDG